MGRRRFAPNDRSVVAFVSTTKFGWCRIRCAGRNGWGSGFGVPGKRGAPTSDATFGMIGDAVGSIGGRKSAIGRPDGRGTGVIIGVTGRPETGRLVAPLGTTGPTGRLEIPGTGRWVGLLGARWVPRLPSGALLFAIRTRIIHVWKSNKPSGSTWPEEIGLCIRPSCPPSMVGQREYRQHVGA